MLSFHHTSVFILFLPISHSRLIAYDHNALILATKIITNGNRLDTVIYDRSFSIYMYICFRFRCSVLKCNPASSSLMSSLYETFSYLLLTKRIAYEPQKLVERSRPSWFVAGTQQVAKNMKLNSFL